MWWATLIGLGCGAPAPAVDPRAASTLFQVQVWAGQGISVEPWRERAVEGLRFYRLSDGHRAWGAVVVGGQPVPLVGAEAFRATLHLIDLEVVDDSLLAGLSMLLLEPGNRVAGDVPWTGAESGDARVPEQQALARSPVLEDQELTYWHWAESDPGLVRCRVMLDSLYVACESGAGLVEEGSNSQDVVARARRELATPNADARLAGVHRLARADTALAGSLLGEVARLDASPPVRVAAVAALGHLVPADGGSILVEVLLHDLDPSVRMAAARALPAFETEGLELNLQIAAKGDPDADVRMAASRSLHRVQR